MAISKTEVRDSDLDDLLCEEAVNDPFSFYAKIRQVHPVYWNKRWNGWVLTGYEAVAAAYRDYENFSSDRFAGPFGSELRASPSDYEQLLRFLSKMFVWKDPPYHTRVRRLVSNVFTPRSIEAIRPRVASLVRELAEPLCVREADFIVDFAFHLPIIVMTEFLGVPAETRLELRGWSNDLAGVVFNTGDSGDRMDRGERAMENLVDFFRPMVRERRVKPREDLLSRMALAQETGDMLSEDEIIANAILMIFAGHETTMNLIANGVNAFHRFPDQWDRLRANPDLTRTAVEEIIRYDGPLRAQSRWAKAPVELCGRSVSAGDRLLLLHHAANHDPAAFADPDGLDIGRTPNRHLGFGHGIHSCVGAPLARLEVQEALAYFSANFAEVRVREQQVRYHPTIVSRGLASLRVVLRTA